VDIWLLQYLLVKLIVSKKSRKAGYAQFANFDLIFKFAIEFSNHCHLIFGGQIFFI